MSERSGWQHLRDRRMAEHGAAEAYEHARLAYELGRAVRASTLGRLLREEKDEQR